MSRIKHPGIRISDPIIIGKEGLKALLEEIKTIEGGKISGIEYRIYETKFGHGDIGRGVSIRRASGPFIDFIRVRENYILNWVYRINEDIDIKRSGFRPTELDKIRDELGKRVYSMARKYGPKLTKQWVLEPKFL